jgi:CheY-like chemotaxis protein
MRQEFQPLCILMVEDESLILEIMAESLVEAGYDVMTAVDGPSAITMIKDEPRVFSALFSDFHLPGGLTGLDIAHAMRDRHPTIPVILATGRPDVLDQRWQSESGFLLLRKPYRPSELLVAMGGLIPPHRQPAGESLGQNDFSKRSM